MSLSYKLFVVLGLTLVVFTADQLTKNWAVASLVGQPAIVYLNGLFQFVYAENPGAFLGMGGDWSRPVRFVVFALIVLFGLGGMLWYLLKKENSRLNLFAYSFILAGGCGNLWDRMVHDRGHVIDFMLIEIVGPIRTGVFNIADMAIVLGVLLVLFGEYWMKKKESV